MPLYRVLLALVVMSALTLSGCERDRPQYAIPSKLSFNPQSGPELTAHDKLEIKIFFKNSQDDSPSLYLLNTGKDEMLNKLSPQLQSAIHNLSSTCKISKGVEKPRPFDNKNKNSDGLTVETSSISGPNCGMTYQGSIKEETRTLNYYLIKPIAGKKADPDVDYNGDYVMKTNSEKSEDVRDQNLQTLVNFSSLRSVSNSTKSYTSRRGKPESSYTNSSFTLDGRASSHDIRFTGEMKTLVKPDRQEAVIDFKVIGFSKEIFFSALGVPTPEGKWRFTYYVNGQKLSAQDIKDYSAIIDTVAGDFQINTDGTIDANQLVFNH